MLELVLLGELAICSLWLLKGTVSSKSTGSLVCTESVAGQPYWFGDLRITGLVKYNCGCHWQHHLILAICQTRYHTGNVKTAKLTYTIRVAAVIFMNNMVKMAYVYKLLQWSIFTTI